MACRGECDVGTSPTCVSGWVGCQRACPVTAPDPNAVGLRAPFLLSPPNASCAPYFDCAAGYYLGLGLQEGPSCRACNGSRPALSVWATPGLSFNDPLSCLWECDPGVSQGPDCIELDRARPNNEAGSYGADPDSQTSCGPGRTSLPGAALVEGDCLACPALPVRGAWILGGAWELSRSASLCQWRCMSGRQRGPACVDELACTVEGRVVDAASGACVTVPFPWQRAGYARTGVVGSAWSPAVSSTPAPAVMRRRLLAFKADAVSSPPAHAAMRRRLLAQPREPGRRLLAYETLAVSAPFPSIGELAGTALDPISGLVALTQQWGVSGRAWVVTTARRWTQAPAALCSVTTATIGAKWYALGAVCNRSLLVWVELPPATGGLQPAAPAAVSGSGVLIGQAQPGWADGFRAEARFGAELYVAFAPGTQTLFVLDRWNCLLREVYIPAVGSPTTRAYTVHGLTSKLLIAGDPQPRCYGDGSLSNPRGLFLGDGGAGEAWLFVDDGGVWQLTASTREVGLAVPASAFPAGLLPAGITWAGASDPYGVQVAWGASGQTFRAAEVACPPGLTSLGGAGCTQACPWATTGGGYNYVDPATGLCTGCLGQGRLGCGLGQRFVQCNQSAPSWCDACPPAAAGAAYTQAGSCEGVARLPPCAAGAYLRGWYCVPCPSFASTLRAGAVRVEQCKCYTGFRRVDGACQARTLYAYPASGLCAAGACPVPANGTLLDARSCEWECAAGTYRVTGAGFWDACQPCLGLPAGRKGFTTPGDDDAPLSCEFE